MHKALVVGVNSMIGSALYQHLNAFGVETFGTTQRKNNLTDHIHYLNLADVKDQWQLPQQTVDVAYICAGVSKMAQCENDPSATHRINVEGTCALIDYLTKRGTFVTFLSTNQVFSGDQPHVLASETVSPRNEYGRQKSQTEAFLQNKDNCAIVRLTKVVEPQMQLIQQWIESLSQNRRIDAFTDMPLAPVALSQVIAVLRQIGYKRSTGIFQISGTEDVSYFDLGCFLADQLNRDRALVNPITGESVGIKKNFLPRFTSLDCSSTIEFFKIQPPQFF